MINVNSGIHSRDSETYRWLDKSKRRRKVVASMIQPVTAAQLTQTAGMILSGSCEILRQLRAYALITCLNSKAMMARVYGLTAIGEAIRRRLFEDRNIPFSEYRQPNVDWHLYGRVCTTNRSIVVRTLTRPMQPCQIKRRALFRFPTSRMTNSNVRGVVRVLLDNSIVEQVWVKGQRHPQYQLTPLGQEFQVLLCRVRRGAWAG